MCLILEKYQRVGTLTLWLLFHLLLDPLLNYNRSKLVEDNWVQFFSQCFFFKFLMKLNSYKGKVMTPTASSYSPPAAIARTMTYTFRPDQLVIVGGKPKVMLVCVVSCHCIISAPPCTLPADTSKNRGWGELNTPSQDTVNSFLSALQVIVIFWVAAKKVITWINYSNFI